MFSLDVSDNVKLYGQESCCWCGAASGKMTMNGYPDPAHRVLYTQQTVWNSIQAHNSTAPADLGWCTDPFGLRDAMMALNAPPAGGHWVVFSDPNRDTVMFDILYWMNRLRYPAPVLVNRGGHWVVIVGFDTDVEPTSGSSPTLSQIEFYDPEPHNNGTDTVQTAASWYAVPWVGPVQYSGTWLNDYVAVVEPPVGRGTVKVRTVKRTARTLISPAQAVEHALRSITQRGLAKMPKYALLRNKEFGHFEPLLVREETGEQRRSVPQYYLVPFGLKRELGPSGVRLARVCVVVNAFTGEVEETTTFGQPVRYLPQDEALTIAAVAFHASPEQIRKAEATLVFQPSEITHIRTYPFYRIKLAGRSIYVDQLGTIYGTIEPSNPGD
jgi:hypothetical protein